MNHALKTKSARWMLAFLGFMLLFWLPLFLISMLAHQFGYGYLPSTAWTETSSYLRIVTGVIGAGLLTITFIKDEPFGSDRLFKKTIGILGAPFVGYFMGSAPIVAGGPMLIAAIAGHHVELIYTVSKADGHGGRGCYSPVALRDLPWFLDSLCYVPDDLRQPLQLNMQILVEGRGTSLGVFATAVHRIGA